MFVCHSSRKNRDYFVNNSREFFSKQTEQTIPTYTKPPLEYFTQRNKDCFYDKSFEPNKNGNFLSNYQDIDKVETRNIDRVTTSYYRKTDVICPANLRETADINTQRIHNKIIQI